MIKHTVFFTLKHAANSPEEASFLTAAIGLRAIPEVKNLECVRQVSSKNAFKWGLVMEFGNQQAYDRYNQHVQHVTFVERYWVPQVSDFLEIDYVQTSL